MSDASKVIDRVTVLVGLIGVLVMATALVVAVRGPQAGAERTVRTEAEIDLSEFSINGDLVVPVGEVSLRVTNSGTVAHNLSMTDGPATPDLNAGESSVLNLGALEPPGIYQLLCSHPGSRILGYDRVSHRRRSPRAATEHAGHGETTDYAAMDVAMMESILEFPAMTSGIGNQVPRADDPLPTGPRSTRSQWRSRPGKSSLEKSWRLGPITARRRGRPSAWTMVTEFP